MQVSLNFDGNSNLKRWKEETQGTPRLVAAASAQSTTRPRIALKFFCFFATKWL
jgi:hypothetical protein